MNWKLTRERWVVRELHHSEECTRRPRGNYTNRTRVIKGLPEFNVPRDPMSYLFSEPRAIWKHERRPDIRERRAPSLRNSILRPRPRMDARMHGIDLPVDSSIVDERSDEFLLHFAGL